MEITRYMAVMPGEDMTFDSYLGHKLRGAIVFLDARPQPTPYVKLRIKVVQEERRYLRNTEPIERTIHLPFGVTITFRAEGKRRVE